MRDIVALPTLLLAQQTTVRPSAHRAWRRPRKDRGFSRVIKAAFTYVAVDPARKPRPLPLEDWSDTARPCLSVGIAVAD